MLCLATNRDPKQYVSRIEIEVPERPFSIETLTRLKQERPNEHIFFVMGADSWMDIRTWREWENVLLVTDHIVVTRPGFEIGFDHVTAQARERIVDLRGDATAKADPAQSGIFITSAVNANISATAIRASIREGESSWRRDVADEVANYIEKYQIYT